MAATGALRPAAYLAFALGLTVALAGCTGGDGDDENGADGDADTAAGAGTILLTIVPVDRPDDLADARVDVTVSHIGLYDNDTERWVPLLAQNETVSLVFEAGLGEPVLVTDVPVEGGRFVGVEVIATRATITHDGTTFEAETPSVACYAPLSMERLTGDAAVEVELWVSGPAALQRDGDTWRFQPAIIGTHAATEDGEVQIVEPDCRAF